MSRTLDELRVGERSTILEVSGDDAVSVRLMEMGLIDGEPIECVGVAPLGDPREYLVRGYHLSLRAEEARRVLLEAPAYERHAPSTRS
jgi:Fe2+ transport system protein FeoA